MSLYSKNAKIDGLAFGLVMRGAVNGQYVVIFERDSATLEQIEAVNWARPVIEGDCILPEGYGFEVEGITYSSAERSYQVTLRVGRQYLGDVTGYVDLVKKLEAHIDEQNAQANELRNQIAEADEALIALYEAGLGSEADAPEQAGPEADSGEEEAQ